MVLLTVACAAAAAPTNAIDVAAGGRTVRFDRDVRPIFEQSCFRCHGPEKPRSDFRLDNRADALNGGNDNTNDIVPGHSDRSKLIAYVAGLDEDIQMPPPDHGPPLTPAQVDTLRAWINQGADWGTNAVPPAVVVSVDPASGWTGVSDNNKKFRELEGIQEGWRGGADHFSYSEQLAPDEKLTMEGHALMPEHDFKVTLALDRTDYGFVHSGFEEWRRYYAADGGYYPPFNPPGYSPDQDLHLDLGRAWIDFGLTLPDTPRLVLGYEYQFRQGDKSTLVWGTVNQGAASKNILPNVENVNEHTHIFKADLTRDWDDWSIQDRVRVEIYRLTDQRDDVTAYTPGSGPDVIQPVHQGVNYSQGANTLRVEKQIADWWLASAGCLLSVYDGTSSFNQTTTDGSGTPLLGQFWRTEGITLHRNSYIVSVGSLFLPLKGLSISTAAQGEWTHENGFGNVDLDVGEPSMPFFTPFPGQVDANLDRTAASENLNIRYARVPHTVLFAEARFQQETVGQFGSATDTNGSPDNLPYGSEQRTDAFNYVYDARAGFTSSPWTWIEWGGHYRYRDSNTSYDHLLDTTPGYPAFIDHRDISLNEITGQLVLRPSLWWNARVTCQWFESDYSTTTEPVAGGISPGGPIEAGTTMGDNVGLNLTFTPGQRFYFSGSFTYGYSRTTTDSGPASDVVPYRGDTYTVGSSAGYALNAKTRLNATYVYSQADYGQNNTAGLPLGIDFTRHELLVGLTRQFTSRLSGALRYSFAQYSQPSSGTLNNFTAQGIFATLSYKWP